MDYRMSIFMAATVASIIASGAFLASATTATRVTAPVCIAWLTISLALFYIAVCFAAISYLRGPTLASGPRPGEEAKEKEEDERSGRSENAEIQRNTFYSLSTFYWCSPRMQRNEAADSASRMPETVINKPLPRISRLPSSTIDSFPMPPGFPPAAYFDSSVADLQTALKLEVIPVQATEVTHRDLKR